MTRMSVLNVRGRNQLFLLLLGLWFIVFYINERFVPYYAAAGCRWPTLEAPDNNVNEIPTGDQDQDPIAGTQETRVLFIADPQLIDSSTYPNRNKIILELSKHTVDTYMKRNYNALMARLKPDYVFFLGDYLDEGRSASKSYFKKELKRFKNIFKLYTYKEKENYFTNLPGNHDIGWADGVKLSSRKRFSKVFGKPNTIKNINNVDFISLDSISLSASNEAIYRDSRIFLDRNFGDAIVKTSPRVLLSHVPLFRDVKKYKCGPLRENPKFYTHGGFQYKSALEPEISKEILRKVKPDLIFTGDDHDYCDIIHNEVENVMAREIAVKSLSMAMGIKYPGVQLLGFVNQNNGDYDLQNSFKYETRLCYAQTPLYNIICYIILALISGISVLIWDLKAASHRSGHSLLPTSVKGTSSSQVNDVPASKTEKFLKLQGDDNYRPQSHSISAYSYTDYPFSGGLWRCSVHVLYPIFRSLYSLGGLVASAARKLKLISFIKHAIIMSTLVIMMYYFGFCLTL